MFNQKKPTDLFRKTLYSLLAFFGTLTALSVGYAAWNATMPTVSPGSAFTSEGWNTVVGNVGHLKDKTTSVSCPAGKFVSGFDADGGAVCATVPTP